MAKFLPVQAIRRRGPSLGELTQQRTFSRFRYFRRFRLHYTNDETTRPARDVTRAAGAAALMAAQKLHEPDPTTTDPPPNDAPSTRPHTLLINYSHLGKYHWRLSA